MDMKPSVQRWTALRWVLLLALGVTLVRAVYLIALCPYHLVEDEAFYWEWSLRPDWSYATKGPGIAWAIWLSTQVFGATEWSLRLIAAVSSGVSTLAIGMLAASVARRVRGDGSGVREGVIAGLLFNAVPVFQGTAILCTIDGPYVACWAVAAWAGWHAVMEGSRRAWVVLGAAIGIGFLFKYTILLLVPGLVVFAAMQSRRSPGSVRWDWACVAGVIAVLGFLPVLVWNSQNDWQTVRHLMGHLGLKGGDVPIKAGEGSRQVFPGAWMLEFVALQGGMILPVVVAVVAAVVWSVRRGGGAGGGAIFSRSCGTAYLLVCAAPILIFYLLVSLMAEAEANWPIAGYVTLLPLAALWLTEIDEPRGLQRFARNFALIGGVISLLVIARADLARSGLELVSPKVASAIPVGRLMGAAPMADDAAARLREIRIKTGKDPVVICAQYGRASRLRFYLPGRPVVYAASLQTGGRKVQQDYWADADLDDPKLLGRPALLVGGDGNGAVWAGAFERVERVADLAGEGKKDRPVFVGYGYRGFASPK